MEEESNKKRKKLCDIELNNLIDRHDEEPPSLVVEASGDDLKLMSDFYLEDSIQRCSKTYESVGSKLPDGGRKLKEKLTSLEQEKESRDRHRLMQGNGAIDAFGNKLNTLGRCDSRKTRSDGLISSVEKCKSGMSSRQTAFRSPRFLSDEVEKLNVSNGDINSSDMEEDPSRFPSRKNSPIVKPSYNLRSRNREQTVILVDEEENQHAALIDEEDNMDASMKEIKIYFPTRCHPESIELGYADMECLAPETYLSSTIMNFYIRYLEQATFTSDSDRCRYHFFTTYFYGKLKEAVQDKTNDMKDVFNKFRRWWKGVNIFEKAYIFLPIHENHHWSLVIICIPDNEDDSVPILLHYDSLGLHSSRPIFENIKSFLKKEWTYLNEKETSSNCPIDDSIWKNLHRKIEKKVITVPQQKDEYDCGLFVLFFMQRFIKEAPQRLKKKDLAMFGKQWFTPEEASDLRPIIRALIKKLFKENPEGGSRGQFVIEC
ncbi:ubiquitin-like-specific protease 1D isoform X1 [Daucus carota subsp. sativus]|uniref:ubiquitin-like-specific protease 1D isoform X1 n=2 Tax=Daucus carota subsp. sativus TaxID=79200 RepID=UPI0007B219AD|nr:PREDICTED: ubiquitin-like-specific protease 1D isoform X1 [Daucus carota subsp. sativus]